MRNALQRFSAGVRLRNTLSNWVLTSEPDESLLPISEVDLHLLPPLGFSALDEIA